jgi:hypothetical protein
VGSRVGLVALLLSLTWSGATQARAADAASSVAAAPSVAAAAGTNAVTLDPHLEPLRPMLGRTWRGVFKSSRPDKPVVDVMHWERVLNGRGVRVLHSINDGSYGGETIFQWNGEKQVVTYHYFTTGGFMTTGTMRFEGGKFQTHEVVSGTTGGVREVKAVSGFEPDGTFVVKTEHLADGKWAPGRETVYREAPDAKVIFR